MLRSGLTSSLRAAFVSLFLPGAAAASAVCDDLWFSRNAAFDAAGYCFQSTLGRRIFDNSDCTSQSVPPLPRGAAAQVQAIQAREAALGCRANTGRDALEAPLPPLRRALALQPIARETESLCIGYIGPALALRTAPDEGGAIIGEIRPGDNVLEFHESGDGWGFASEVKRVGAEEVILGWYQGEITLCEARAG